jgi:hypothetical protein
MQSENGVLVLRGALGNRRVGGRLDARAAGCASDTTRTVGEREEAGHRWVGLRRTM